MSSVSPKTDSKKLSAAISVIIFCLPGLIAWGNDKFTVTPHVLRHTFLRWLAETKGIQYAMKVSGHKTDRYIWRYVEPKEESLAEAVEDME